MSFIVVKENGKEMNNVNSNSNLSTVNAIVKIAQIVFHHSKLLPF